MFSLRTFGFPCYFLFRLQSDRTSVLCHYVRCLLGVGGIVEQHGQLDVAMAKLGKAGRVRIRGVEIRSGIVRRKQNQRVQKGQDSLLVACRQRGKGLGGRYRFATMPEDDLFEGDTASIMSIGRRAPHSP